jgi:hypothetical protein
LDCNQTQHRLPLYQIKIVSESLWILLAIILSPEAKNISVNITENNADPHHGEADPAGVCFVQKELTLHHQ